MPALRIYERNETRQARFVEFVFFVRAFNARHRWTGRPGVRWLTGFAKRGCATRRFVCPIRMPRRHCGRSRPSEPELAGPLVSRSALQPYQKPRSGDTQGQRGEQLRTAHTVEPTPSVGVNAAPHARADGACLQCGFKPAMRDASPVKLLEAKECLAQNHRIARGQRVKAEQPRPSLYCLLSGRRRQHGPMLPVALFAARLVSRPVCHDNIRV